MRKVLCDKCGCEIVKDVFEVDDSLKGNLHEFRGQILVGKLFKFPDESEPTVKFSLCDLCDSCKEKFDSLVTAFMTTNES